MKRPFELVTETLLENLDKVRENQRLNFTNSEKFMIWIVGFSIGGVSIIVSNLTQFQNTYSYTTSKTILGLLSTSIIAGIIYRWAFYVYQIYYQNIEFQLQGAFSNKEFMDPDYENISHENNILEVIRRLKDDFGEDASFVLELYKKAGPAIQLDLLNDLKSHYNKIGESVKKEYEFAMTYVKSVYKSSFGLSQRKIDRLFDSQSPNKFKLYRLITTIAFLLSCFTFISVLIILCCNF